MKSQVEFLPTAEDQVAAMKVHFRLRLRRWSTWRGYFLLLGALFAALLLYFLIMTHDLADAGLLGLYSVLGGAIALLLCLVVNYLRLPGRVRRSFSQQKALHDPLRLSWSADGLSWESPLWNQILPWKHAREWHDSEHVMIIYAGDHNFHYLPKRVFDAGQVENISSMIAAAGVRRR